LTLHLQDGSEIADVDEVWVGTGYGWTLPFVRVLKAEGGGGGGGGGEGGPHRRRLSPLTPPSLNLSRIPSFHRFIPYAPNPPSACVGQVMSFTPFILADVSSTWLALAWSGELPYPSSIEGRLAFERERLAQI